MEPSSTSSRQLLDEYTHWLSVEKGRARATIDAYRRDGLDLVAWLEERGRHVRDVSAGEMDTYLARLRQGRAASTLARATSSLRGWFSFLVDEGHRVDDPLAHVRPVRRGRRLPRPLSESEVASLLDGLPRQSARDRRDRALLELLYGTGARVSEAVGLTLGDLDFDEKLIRVMGKGSKQRLVPMGRTLEEALRDYLGPEGRGALLTRVSDRLLLNNRGGALSRQGVDLIIAKRALNAGMDRSRVSAHVFRHSCATHMLAHGADIRVVQELLGHASIATTQLYTAVSATSLQREYENAHPRAHE